MKFKNFPLVLMIIAMIFFGVACSQAPELKSEIEPREKSVDWLLSQMTLEEKSGMLHGAVDPNPDIGLNGAGYVGGVPRLNIPPLRFADGPAGMRTSLPATALPSPIGLAASFDPELAYRYGEVIGVEGKARNQDVLLSPMVNIIRVPLAGRNFETFGEDPVLASKIVAAEIKGIQSKGLMATVKHYIANNQEDNRTTINVIIDERTLREIYLPGFLAAIDADVASIMCAYNKVNGFYACENPTILKSLLRDDFSYEGFVMTDWWAGHSSSALDHGLNLEMPGYEWPGINSKVVFSQKLIDSVKGGKTDQALVDQALRPLLVQMKKYGFLSEALASSINKNGDKNSFEKHDKKKHTLVKDAEKNIDVQAHTSIALEAATKSAVLLKNENRALPLSAEDASNLLVIGPTARTALIGGGGSSKVIPFRRGSPLTAIEQLAGLNGTVAYAVGVDLDGEVIPASALRSVKGSKETGLRFEFNGETSISEDIDFVGDDALSVEGDLNWKGILNVETTGNYELKIQVNSGRAQLSLDGEIIASTSRGVLSQASLIPTQLALTNASGGVRLEVGRDYVIEVIASTDSNSVLETNADVRDKFEIRLAWSTPEHQQKTIADALEQAEKASAVVVFAYIEGTEGGDRKTLALPGYQDELITALAKQGLDKLIVVLNVGAPIAMPWKNEVDAILQMWYPGQEGGNATASLLYGHANPSGKLPVTFPASETEVATNAPLQYPGVDGFQEYSEGLYVGYRWYDKNNVEPLFPFGHGLSYSAFSYSDLVVTEKDGEFEVSISVRNTSGRGGAVTPQLYLGQSNSELVDTEVQKLVDFQKVYLASGEKSVINFTINSRALSIWNTANHAWERLAGERKLFVGSSSRDIRLSTSIAVE